MPKSPTPAKQLLESTTTTKSDTVQSEEISKVGSVIPGTGDTSGGFPASVTPNDAHSESEARGSKETNTGGGGESASPDSVGVSSDGKDGSVDSSVASASAVGGVTNVAGSTVSSEGATVESSILKRMEDTFQTTLETQGQLQQLTQLIGALEKAPSEFPQTAPVVEPMSETGPPRDVPPVGDSIAHVALIGAGMEDEGAVALEVCQQPSNSAGVDEGEIVVAGEILSGTSAGTRQGPANTTAETKMEPAYTGIESVGSRIMEPAGTSMGANVEDAVGKEAAAREDPCSDFNHTHEEITTNLNCLGESTSVSSDPNLATSISPQSPTPTTPKSLTPLKGPPKRPRFQLAASFTHQQ